MKAKMILSAVALAASTSSVGPAVANVAPSANLTNITKSFEFGPGTPNPISNQRGFDIPSGLEVATVVKFRRLGTGKEGIPISIELREPDTSPGVEGPIVETKAASAQTFEQSVTIRSLASNRGCGRPWRVRVKYAGTDPAPPNAVFGTARMDWDGTTRRLSAETPGLVIRSTILSQKEAKIGPATGIGQGALGITANWNHMIGPVIGPSPVKFRVFLLFRPQSDPENELIVESVDAYSSNEANATPRFSMIHRLRDPLPPGQWSLLFELKDPHDAFIQTPVVNFSPTCT